MDINQDYTLFYKFIETYGPVAFKGITNNDPLMVEMEEMMEKNNQYFFIGDLLQGNIIYTSKRSMDILGVEPAELTPYHAIEACHPDEKYKNTNGWAKIISMANKILVAKSGSELFSINMKLQNPKGSYSEILFQCYLFYSTVPHETVYDLQIHTNLDKFKLKKTGYHYYSGNDLSLFKYPDNQLLEIGNLYTKREIEIIKFIESELSSEQIAEKLFLSHYTVNSHRANILKKSGKANISNLIFELKERGMF
jgi:DNA-binding CsgD family transcriptional regulator